MRNYYKVLEVAPTATAEEIKAQHRLMLQAWHPDKFATSEQKAKAEEKTKTINEAYRILGDSLKREEYDRALKSHSSQPATKPEVIYCQSCGLPGETKYVEFYQNIGMVIMRHHRSIKGELCKSCIDYYFWNLTGKTMLLGWWGIISFLVTPLILLNNTFRYIFSLGLTKPPLQVVPSPSPFLVFSTIGGWLSIGFLIYSAISQSAAPTAYTTPTQMPRTAATAKVDAPAAKIKTPTSTGGDCVPWAVVTARMIGQDMCVYGTVHRTQHVGQSTFQVRFSSNEQAFFLAGGAYFYEVRQGDCVVAEGEILRSGAGIPYINIDKALYHCEPWMK